MDNSFEKKYNQSIKLLSLLSGKIEVAYSGGKDSDVILNLCKDAGLQVTPVYRATTIDPPYTIKHVKSVGGVVVRPNKTFFQLIAEKGYPSRFRRFCCRELKELPPLNETTKYVIVGIRKSESSKRAKRYKEPTECKIRKGVHYEAVYPILDWTDADILQYIEDRQIKLHPLYYKKDGSIDVKKRLGCLCCPLQSDNGKSDFLRYPKMVKAWTDAYNKFIVSHPDSKSANIDAYKQFYAHITHNNDILKGELFDTDYKQVIEDYFCKH